MKITLDHVKRALKALSEHSGAITAIIAGASFFVAYLQAILFAHGQVDIANLVIQEVGIVPMWIKSLILMFNIIVPVVFAVLIIRTNGMIWKAVGTGPAGMIVILMISILSVAHLIGFVVLYLLNALADILERKYPSKKKHSRAEAIAVISIGLLTISISSFPMLPPNYIELKSGEKMVATKISTDEGNILVQDNNTKQLKQVMKDKITKFEICTTTKSEWASKTAFDLALSRNDLLNKCPDL